MSLYSTRANQVAEKLAERAELRKTYARNLAGLWRQKSEALEHWKIAHKRVDASVEQAVWDCYESASNRYDVAIKAAEKRFSGIARDVGREIKKALNKCSARS